MKVTLNGEPREFAQEMMLGALLRELGVPAAGIAVALNERVVPRAVLDRQPVADGDAIEIIRAVAGG